MYYAPFGLLEFLCMKLFLKYIILPPQVRASCTSRVYVRASSDFQLLSALMSGGIAFSRPY